MADVTFATLSFTPGASGKAVAQAQFESAATASDWGASVSIELRETHSSTTTVLETFNPPSARQRAAMLQSFEVVGGVAYVVDLVGDCSGATAVTAWNIKLHVEVIKR